MKRKPKRFSKFSRKVEQRRGVSSLVKKLSDEEIKTFLAVLGSLMAQVPAPRDARKCYLKEVESRLRHEGAGFLSRSRVFPTFGLKLLGNDLTGFPVPGFKKASGKIYPKLMAWYWSELARLSQIKQPSAVDAQRAQRVLVVLSFAKMIKVSSVRQISNALKAFETRVVEKDLSGTVNTGRRASASEPGRFTDPDSMIDRVYYLSLDSLQSTIGTNVDLEQLPEYMDLDSLSTKPSALKDRPAFPIWFSRFEESPPKTSGKELVLAEDMFAYKRPPFGKVHVLTESAGKLRVILPYNTPFVHSTGLYARSRALLRLLLQDCSENQSTGHHYVQKGTTFRYDGRWNISADLDAFSDSVSVEAIRFGLQSLRLPLLDDYLFNLPVSMPNGKVIVPNKLLMGLKGCFELSTLLHHYAAQGAGVKNYTMCGDDLYFRGSLEDFESYIKSINSLGWNINRNKTIVSKTVATFCGECYWNGIRVSPRVPKVSSLFKPTGLACANIMFSVTRDTIVSLNGIYKRRSVARIIGHYLRLIRIRWKGAVFPELPTKLRGLGLKPSKSGRGIIEFLENKCALKCALISIGLEREALFTDRWFGLPIQLSPSTTKDYHTFDNAFPALKQGSVKLDIPVKRSAFAKDVSSLDISDALEWYYSDVRLSRDSVTRYVRP